METRRALLDEQARRASAAQAALQYPTFEAYDEGPSVDSSGRTAATPDNAASRSALTWPLARPSTRRLGPAAGSHEVDPLNRRARAGDGSQGQ